MSESGRCGGFRCAALAMALAVATTGAAGEPALRDPTVPPGADARNPPLAPEAPPELHLSSTYVSDGRRIAVINGRRVSEDSRIEGAHVVEILPGKVRLEHGGERFTLRLAPGVRQQSES